MATAVELVTEDVTAKALTWPERARELTIQTTEAYVHAGQMLLDIKALRKEIDGAFDPIITKAHAAHKEACGQKNRAEAPLLEAEQILKRGLVAWDSEQERVRRAEEQRLQHEARVQEEAARARQAAALEIAANATGDESLRLEAEELISAPVCAPVISLPRATPKVAGLSYRENWRADATVDLKTLCAAIGRGEQPTSYVQANLPALNGVVRALKGQAQIPGVKVVCEKIASAGR